MQTSHLHGSEIAVIGMEGRFPGANNIQEFWNNLCKGTESIKFYSNEEIAALTKKTDLIHQENFVKAAPLLKDVDKFDAEFFGYTPNEAEIMDPQQRLFLECSWASLEDAGYDPDLYRGKVGVFAGSRMNTYIFNIIEDRELRNKLGSVSIGVGNDFGLLASRIAYKLNLNGPSYSLHTGCSTSLVNIHLACQSLLINECSMAIAGGISMYNPDIPGYIYQPGGMLSSDGHCRSFDAQANGTVFGSGVGAVVLKRLEDALKDGDHIYAVIKGSATNNDGANKASFTAPGVKSQAEVINEALLNAGVKPESIGYIEAHGSGTLLGDTIEVHALNKVFKNRKNSPKTCAIGSVKTNIGHLEAAAGMAGFIKTVLAVKNKVIPPTLHFKKPNPEI
ncbi:beta-ketoacyl synthase N-terminal-like domain-containing protein, partial [Bacillus wiedmannii]|uniref:beta-ketoacyl synthase N-terminal-like domain-containing protein n=1 Tax=Bacillus wiedmannii TaxID=1890302 RepID=UPI000BFB0234